VGLARGESIEPGCFSLAPGSIEGLPRVGSARVSIERASGSAHLRVRGFEPVSEPAVSLAIAAACAGQSGTYERRYAVLLDPRPVPREAHSPLGETIATLIARIGDTLQSLAHALFPESRRARTDYIAALREKNPALQALADTEPIPTDTVIALPDPRSLTPARAPGALSVAPSAAPSAQAEMPAKPKPAAAPRKPAGAPQDKPAAPPPRAKRAAPAEPIPTAPAPAQRPAPVAAPAAPPRAAATSAFVLKLSNAQMDLTPSRSMDDRKRAQLRDRQLVLDVDDQVAAVLALRNSVRQLETRVTELQLKLAQMPSQFPPPRTPEPKVAEVARPPAPEVKAPPPEVKAPPPEVKAPVPEVKAPAPPVKEPAPEVKAPAPEVKAPPAEAKPPPVAETKPVPAPPAPEAKPVPAKAAPAGAPDGYGTWILWGGGALLALFAALLAWRLARREAQAEAVAEEDERSLTINPIDEPIVVAEEPERIEPGIAAIGEDGRRVMASDAQLTTRINTGDADDLRRRYIEERFPEISKGVIALDDPKSVIKAARLFYEDREIERAVELLQYAIERNPAEVKPWLALFEIYRLERLDAPYAALARRFEAQHGATPWWPKVQYFGREIDSGNKLYQDFRGLETIGPRGARAASTFDPIAENWLNAPMDFENEVLANDMRKSLLAGAGITDRDLIPNPMPALRNVEMFTVA
jgi:hypothetical protein